MNIVVLSGAGMSAESGISTFRDQNGLWENHDIMDVASIEGWQKNPALVLDFYNKRRAQLFEVHPNSAHLKIASWQENHHVVVVTQNVDDLHERAGSTNIIHLHGTLRSVRSQFNSTLNYYWEKDLHIGDKAEDGHQLRPDIVWFGEDVTMIESAIEVIAEADVLIVIGTSLQVYPAAGLLHYAHKAKLKYIIDPNCGNYNVPNDFIKIESTAVNGIELVDFNM
jgi:NAD-dependent deacetylase